MMVDYASFQLKNKNPNLENFIMLKTNNITEIISLGQVLMGHELTQKRGAALLVDLADELMPEKVVTTGTAAPAPLVLPKAEKKVDPAPASAPAPAPQQPVAPQAPAAPSMTPEELNNALVVEFRRLGSREAIDQAMAELGVTSVNDLKPEQYNVLLTKVQGIK